MTITCKLKDWISNFGVSKVVTALQPQSDTMSTQNVRTDQVSAYSLILDSNGQKVLTRLHDSCSALSAQLQGPSSHRRTIFHTVCQNRY